MKPAKKLLLTILFPVLLISGGIFLYVIFSDKVRIQGLLQTAEEAVEKEDLEKLMGLISPRYQDAHGLDRLMVRQLMAGVFRDFDHLEVVGQEPMIQVNRDQAEAQIPVHLLVDWAGQRSYLVGSSFNPARVKIVLRKEGLHWRVVRVEGIK